MVSNHESLDSTCAARKEFSFLDVVCAFEGADVEAVHHHFAAELVPVLLDVVVLHHNYHHVDVLQELVEVAELVLGNLIVYQERVIALL